MRYIKNHLLRNHQNSITQPEDLVAYMCTFTITTIVMYGDPVLNCQIKTKDNLGPNC